MPPCLFQEELTETLEASGACEGPVREEEEWSPVGGHHLQRGTCWGVPPSLLPTHLSDCFRRRRQQAKKTSEQLCFVFLTLFEMKTLNYTLPLLCLSGLLLQAFVWRSEVSAGGQRSGLLLQAFLWRSEVTRCLGLS